MIAFRVLCFLQMLATVFLTFRSLMDLFTYGRFYFALQSFFFMLMAALAILGLAIVASNYPDKPVSGKQKTTFNWLFLLNFLLIAFLFGLVFSEFNRVQVIANLFGKKILQLPFQILTDLIVYIVLLLFHFLVLYGLYVLRRQLFLNAYNKQFEFEREQNA